MRRHVVGTQGDVLLIRKPPFHGASPRDASPRGASPRGASPRDNPGVRTAHRQLPAALRGAEGCCRGGPEKILPYCRNYTVVLLELSPVLQKGKIPKSFFWIFPIIFMRHVIIQ